MPWQDSQFLNWPTPADEEEWWPLRTHNWNTAQPLRSNLGIRDYVLTYDSNNEMSRYADIVYNDAVYFRNSYFGSAFDNWLDPFFDISSN